MQPTRDPFGRALCAIRSSLRAGRWVLGERLAVSELSLELNLSATPVREALARLSGEGLIEERRGQGYFAWRLDTVDLVELYDLQGLYLVGALDHATAGSGKASEPGAGSHAERTEAAFARIVRLGVSALLSRSNALLADRLAAARLAEGQVLQDIDAELRAIEDCDDPGRLRDMLKAYHGRRVESAGAVVAALRSLAAAGKI